MKIFHTMKYPHEKLNTSKGVIRRRVAALATEEIESALEKQGVTNIRKSEQLIQTNTYILIFNQFRTLKEVKIGYCFERVEPCVLAPQGCFKCQKYRHHREACRRRQTCVECREKDQDHVEEDCFYVQTADKIFRLSQDLVMFTKMKRK